MPEVGIGSRETNSKAVVETMVALTGMVAVRVEGSRWTIAHDFCDRPAVPVGPTPGRGTAASASHNS